ncbi:MAG: hypothetical protein P8M10_04605, partial [Ilumatobacter sp.]|nr:hypothetical protein [Ilumatobacter sp.]
SVSNPSNNIASATDVVDVACISVPSATTSGATSALSVANAGLLSTSVVVSFACSMGGSAIAGMLTAGSPMDGGVWLVGSISAHAAIVSAAAQDAATHRQGPVHHTPP